MTHQGITLTGVDTHYHRVSDKTAVRKVVYNLLAVVALFVAAVFVASAYHPTDWAVSNPRFESMGAFHAPMMFRGAPPSTHIN